MSDPLEHREAQAVSGEILLKGAGYGIRMIFPEAGNEDKLLSDLEKLFGEASLLSGNLGVVLDFQGRRVSRFFIQKLLSDFIWSRRYMSFLDLLGRGDPG